MMHNEKVLKINKKYNYFDDGNDDMITFVRTVDNRWFSLGYCGGVLDVDGSLVKSV